MDEQTNKQANKPNSQHFSTEIERMHTFIYTRTDTLRERVREEEKRLRQQYIHAYKYNLMQYLDRA